MADRPIDFRGPMIRALQEGRKVQHRRILKMPSWAQPEGWPEKIMDEMDLDGRLYWYAKATGCLSLLPIPQIGDRLWARETIGYVNDHGREAVLYRADDRAADFPDQTIDDHIKKFLGAAWVNDLRSGVEGRWTPSTQMPRWASRLTLTVTDVRVQRVQDMNMHDAFAEGIPRPKEIRLPVTPAAVEALTKLGVYPECDPFAVFADLWNSLHGPDAWHRNDWVEATTFTVEKQNIDSLEGGV